MLRIDESSKTLVAPQGGFAPDVAPDRPELLALLAAGWDAFAVEIGQPNLRFLAAEPEPGVDVLAFDAVAGRVVVVVVGAESPREQMARALIAAGEVAGWDAQDLAEVHADLQAAVPGDSPRILLVGGGWDDQTIATFDWLVRRHGLEVAAYGIHMMRFGAERLMQVVRAYPAAEAAQPDPTAQFFGQATVAPASAPDGAASTPPPGVPAA